MRPSQRANHQLRDIRITRPKHLKDHAVEFAIQSVGNASVTSGVLSFLKSFGKDG